MPGNSIRRSSDLADCNGIGHPQSHLESTDTQVGRMSYPTAGGEAFTDAVVLYRYGLTAVDQVTPGSEHAQPASLARAHYSAAVAGTDARKLHAKLDSRMEQRIVRWSPSLPDQSL